MWKADGGACFLGLLNLELYLILFERCFALGFIFKLQIRRSCRSGS